MAHIFLGLPFLCSFCIYSFVVENLFLIFCCSTKQSIHHKIDTKSFLYQGKEEKKCCHPLSHRTLSTVINLSCQIFRLIFMLQFNSQLRAILSIHQQCVIRVFVSIANSNWMRKTLDVIWWSAYINLEMSFISLVLAHVQRTANKLITYYKMFDYRKIDTTEYVKPSRTQQARLFSFQ